jgi:protocatechuate 3,4-dioxygenase alpha subunit
MSLTSTTSQTVGPFFLIGLERMSQENLAPPGVFGERIEIVGRVIDGDGAPVPDAVIEIWQANTHGKYAHPEDLQEKPIEPQFRGYGRSATDDDGKFHFTTIKPGRVPAPDGTLQAPHLAVSVFMRGLLIRLVTRIYFPNDPANDQDFALNLVEAPRRGTLIAKKAAGKPSLLEWNVVLQGPDETVFFDC